MEFWFAVDWAAGWHYSLDMKVSAQYAAEHFEDLVVAAHNGEPVEIACAGKPGLQLVRSAVANPAAPLAQRVLGAGKAIFPLPEEAELDRIDQEWKHAMDEKTFG